MNLEDWIFTSYAVSTVRFLSISSDWSYYPKYNNADDSEEYKVANGFSYHQGPVSFPLLLNV